MRSTVAAAPLTLLLALGALTACSSSETPEPEASASATESAAPAETSSAATDAAGENLTLQTDRGTITIAMDSQAPQTVASLSQLAASGYFDNTTCHRLVTTGIHVLQCGDPTGTGQGDPEYTTTLPDENTPAAAKDNYPAGTVAMANRGTGTASTQFFIVYQDSTLTGPNGEPPTYTVWGEVSQGLDVVEKIASEGNAADGVAPKTPVTIESATVS